jgi:hypothetical protein
MSEIVKVDREQLQLPVKVAWTFKLALIMLMPTLFVYSLLIVRNILTPHSLFTCLVNLFFVLISVAAGMMTYGRWKKTAEGLKLLNNLVTAGDRPVPSIYPKLLSSNWFGTGAILATVFLWILSFIVLLIIGNVELAFSMATAIDVDDPTSISTVPLNIYLGYIFLSGIFYALPTLIIPALLWRRLKVVDKEAKLLNDEINCRILLTHDQHEQIDDASEF